jgi:hypothetical protein
MNVRLLLCTTAIGISLFSAASITGVCLISGKVSKINVKMNGLENISYT